MRLWLVVALLCFVAAQPALAQPAPASQQEPPSRVGTVSIASGNLAFHTAGDTQWSAAGVNYPVATGGSFWTDPQARAQIQIGPSTIAMDGGTEIDVTELNQQAAQLGLQQGRIHLHLRQLDTGQSFEIDLPQGAVRLLQPGSYDIDAGSPDQGARIAVFAGSARFVGSGADLGINSGDEAVLSHTNPVAIATQRAGSDAFVEWCSAHDYHEDHLASPYYVSAQMTGYSGLDTYGNWQSNPQYGEVWYPSQIPADWAPYRDGHWIWVAPWGWTWVDQQPWGFAPFHYGRWAYAGDRWGWVPGSYVAQPVYAPALVAFVGLAAAGIGAAAGVGPAVGWFPLAPGEVYWPSYTRNAAYIRNVNITNVKNINNVVIESHGATPPQIANGNFANRRFATVVPQRVFANADPVAPAIVHVPPAALQKAPVAVHPPQVTPVLAHTAVAGPPQGAPNAAGLGPNRLAPGTSGQPGGAAPRPTNTAALPARPTASGPASTERSGSPAAPHPEPPAAPTTAALAPQHSGATPPLHEARPATSGPVRPPAAVSARREGPPAASEARPAPSPRPAAPPPRPPTEAAIVHPPARHLPRPPVHPAVVRPHPMAAPAHPPQPAHGPAPAHGGKPPPKKGGKDEERHG